MPEIKLVNPRPAIDRISDQGELIWTMGLPGCGKSTWVERARREDPTHVYPISRDGLRTEWGIGYQYDQFQEAAISWAINGMAEALLARGAIVIIDATNLLESDRLHWERMASRCGVPCRCKDMTGIGVAECIQRVAERVRAGGKYIPDEVIEEWARRAGIPG